MKGCEWDLNENEIIEMWERERERERDVISEIKGRPDKKERKIKSYVLQTSYTDTKTESCNDCKQVKT